MPAVAASTLWRVTFKFGWFLLSKSTVYLVVTFETTCRHLKTHVEKAGFLFFLPSVHVVVIALNLRTKSMIPSALVVGKTEITSLSCRTILSSHREWQRAGSRFEPLVCTKRRRPLLSPLPLLFDRSSHCTGDFAACRRMLCTTSPGECVGTPDSIQVCLAFSPDAYVEGQELLPRQAAGISVQTGLVTPWYKLDPPFNVTTAYEAQVCVVVRTCIFMRVKLCLSP